VLLCLQTQSLGEQDTAQRVLVGRSDKGAPAEPSPMSWIAMAGLCVDNSTPGNRYAPTHFCCGVAMLEEVGALALL